MATIPTPMASSIPITQDPQTLNDIANLIVQNISAELFTVLFKLVLIGVIIIFFKTTVEGIANYLLFRMDPFISRGTLIKYNGVIWRIKHAGIFSIDLECSEGYMSVSVKHWREMEVLILKNYKINAIKGVHVECIKPDPTDTSETLEQVGDG